MKIQERYDYLIDKFKAIDPELLSKILDEPGFLPGNYKGYKTLITRSSPYSLGHLTAYVEIPKSHKCFGFHYDEIEISVHGGLTFSGGFFGEDWWIGFDCAHFNDQVPFLKMSDRDTYRDVGFCKGELEKMINQLEEQI